jgi:hypothetical protein
MVAQNMYDHFFKTLSEAHRLLMAKDSLNSVFILNTYLNTCYYMYSKVHFLTQKNSKKNFEHHIVCTI